MGPSIILLSRPFRSESTFLYLREASFLPLGTQKSQLNLIHTFLGALRLFPALSLYWDGSSLLCCRKHLDAIM